MPDTSWSAVNTCLYRGLRGLNPGSSLAKLLLEHRGRRHKQYLPRLTPTRILTWADAHHARTGEWPGKTCGPVAEAPGETWSGVDAALAMGLRGLPSGSSLPQLLAAQRGVRNHLALPPFTVEQILAWADTHHARTGAWPRRDAGPIPEAPGESWGAVDKALIRGLRGQPGGRSLAQLLQAERGVRNPAAVPRLEPWEVLFWADTHHTRTGHWPTATSGPIPEAPGETWSTVDEALRFGRRGLPDGSSLPRLLGAARGVRHRGAVSSLTPDQILAWADTHHARTGRWPNTTSGPVPEAPGETWSAVAAALNVGNRGLPGGTSLARLLTAHRGVRNHRALPPLTRDQILAWADAHHTRTGRWPTVKGGPIPEAPGETWQAVETGLIHGIRGLSGGDSLARFLARHRGARNPAAVPALSVERIRQWVRAHVQRTGRGPCRTDGPIPSTRGETWMAVDQALHRGQRGLPGGSSLAKVVQECPRPSSATDGASAVR